MSYVLINLRSHDNELLQSSDLIVQASLEQKCSVFSLNPQVPNL